MKIEPEYLNNVCLFNPGHPVEIVGSFKIGGKGHTLRLRAVMPPDLHKELTEWAATICDINAAQAEKE